MVHNLLNRKSLLHVAVQHRPDQFNAPRTHLIRYSQIAIHNLVNAIEGIFLVDDGVEEDTKGPDVLFFAVIGLCCKDFGCCVICLVLVTALGRNR